MSRFILFQQQLCSARKAFLPTFVQQSKLRICKLNTGIHSHLRNAVNKSKNTPVTKKNVSHFCGYSLVFAIPLATKSKFPFIAKCHTAETDVPQEVYRHESLTPNSDESAGSYYSILFRTWDGVRLFFRSIRILCTFLPIFAFYPIAQFSERLNEWWWSSFIMALEVSGPTFVKLGQWASTRRDLFSVEFCERISKLHRRTTPHSWFYTKRKLTKAFGKRWKEILLKFEDKDNPVGSGCVAQVYKAYMPPEMIVDEEVAEEIKSLMEEELDKPAVNDGLEILGFGKLISKVFRHKTLELDQYPDDRTAGTGRFKQKKDSALVTESVAGSLDSTVDYTRDDENEGLIPVAVKVLHPGVYRATMRDLRIMKAVSYVMQFLLPRLQWLSLPECVDEFSDLMMKQIDLRNEARNLDRFNDLFEKVTNVRFPHPIWPFVKCNVLVETWEDGTFISDYITNDQNEETMVLQEKLADIGVDTLLQMVFTDNFVHGDLHPGNILVQNAAQYKVEEENKLFMVDVGDTVVVSVEKAECPVRLVLLDAGITSSLSEKDKEIFSEVFKCVILGAGEEVAQLFLDHCPYHRCTNIPGFKKELAELIDKAKEQTVTLGKMKVGELLADVFSILCRHKVKLESNFASIVLAIMVLEGLGRSLDPRLNILQKALPVLLPEMI